MTPESRHSPIVFNRHVDRSYRGLFTDAEYADVRAFFESHDDLTPTPLARLDALATASGISEIFAKNETSRFGLPAFKIVGVTYAVDRLLRASRAATLACATAGNHGRAVARVARSRGLEAVVYMRDGSLPATVERVRGEGARVVLVDGSYDDAVRRMAKDAATHGWTIVSDTAWEGYEQIPRDIMAGYTWIMMEAARQWSRPPTAIVVQAGVGGLMAAVASWVAAHADRSFPRPLVVCAEPRGSNCVGRAIETGRATAFVPDHTIMAGLHCGEVSTAALPALLRSIDVVVSVDDEDVIATMRQLDQPIGHDPKIKSGPSGACGLAAVLSRDNLRREIAAAAGSCVLVVITEAATDPARAT